MVARVSLALLYPVLLVTLFQQGYAIQDDVESESSEVDATLFHHERINLEPYLQRTKFTLYTKKNPTRGQVLRLNNSTSVRTSNFNPKLPTVLITHGWNMHCGEESCVMVRDAYLNITDSFNVILFDWSSISLWKEYGKVRKTVHAVGDHYAEFLNFMRQSAGLKHSKTTMVGHSLGAHVSSFAAKSVSRHGKIANVFGLDPAGWGFFNSRKNNRIDKSHAANVQILHTCEGSMGLVKKAGHSDFVANLGSVQPGCSGMDILRCSHRRAYFYFSESVRNPKAFPAKGKNGKIAYMGGPTPDPKASGTYHFETNAEPPYGMGYAGMM